MKLSLTCVILIAFLSASYAGTGRGKYLDPKHPEDCTYTSGVVLGVGETHTLPSGECGEIECREDNIIVTKGCPLIKAARGCKLLEPDNKADYPKCCDRKQVCKRDSAIRRVIFEYV